jgi:hypothetical protein
VKSFDDYQKLAKQASEQARSGKVDPGIMHAKAEAFNAYRAEARQEARKGRPISNGKPVMVKKQGKLVPKTAPSRRSLQEEYVRKLSDDPLPKSTENPEGHSPRQLAVERLGV